MASTTQYVTADELFNMPDNGGRYELVRGELREMSPAGARHGNVGYKIGLILGAHIEANRLGMGYCAETGFRLASNPDTVLAPDFAFVVAERAAVFGDVISFLPGPPDLAVEVISPSQSYTDIEEKTLTYLEHGTRVVVLADPDKRRLVIRRPDQKPVILGEADRFELTDLLPGFSTVVKSFFE